MRQRIIFILLTFGTGLLISGCSSGLKLTSDWSPTEMKIDGSDADWQRGLYYDEVSDMVYGVRNDNQNMYLFLKTQNRATQMQILRGSFTVWFDPSGGKDHAIGIHYPLGRGGGRPLAPTEMEDDQVNEQQDPLSEELEIVGPREEDIQRNSAIQAPGIRVRITHTRNVLIYELCMPLKKTQARPFAIGFIPGKRIGVGFEGGELKRKDRNNELSTSDQDVGRRAMPGGEMGLDGAGHSRHRGGMSNNGVQMKTMKFWLSVQLAGTPTGDH